MPGRLEGKRAIVTGAASGIGRASAQLFAAEGATVVAADVSAAALADTVATIAAAGGRAHAVTCDVGDPAQVAALCAGAIRDHGGVDVMFANAGITGRLVPMLELDADDFAALLRVNLIGAFLCVKHAALHMREHGGGSIICTASVAGLRAGAGPAHYSASKAGIINLVQTAAVQLVGTGVRVNAICPGLIETGMTAPIFEGARKAGKADKIGQLNPTQRAGQPEEIARAALFLASDEASYVDGQALVVDGGLSSSHPFVPGRIL